MTRILTLLLVMAVIGHISNAQAWTHSITGEVVDAATHQPMQGAYVFAENTTIGSVTDQNGRFVLSLPDGGFDLVVSYTGYVTQSRKISNGMPQEFHFEMTAREKTMQEVSVVSTGEVKDGQAKYGLFFFDEFIGKTPNSQQCIIKNPEVLRYFFNKRKNRLKILANEPLLIENNALGYHIRYELDSFVHEYPSATTIYTGFPEYEPMSDSSRDRQDRWATARAAAYEGSLLQFMRSLFQKNLSDNGYEIMDMRQVNRKDTAIRLSDDYGWMHYTVSDSANLVSIQPLRSRMGILYNLEEPMREYVDENPGTAREFQFSTLDFQPDKKIFIESNGYYYPQNEVTVNDYWEWSRVADALPYDYQPEP